MPPHRRALDGIGWVPQEREIFPSLSVEENLTVAARPGRWDLARVFQLFPRLAERRGNMGHHLSGGEQQMLAIARALMTNPALLLLDEPLEGLAPIVVEELAAAIRRLRADDGAAVILVEQHAEIALSLTESALVLERGSVVHRAPSRALMEDRGDPRSPGRAADRGAQPDRGRRRGVRRALADLPRARAGCAGRSAAPAGARPARRRAGSGAVSRRDGRQLPARTDRTAS